MRSLIDRLYVRSLNTAHRYQREGDFVIDVGSKFKQFFKLWDNVSGGQNQLAPVDVVTEPQDFDFTV